MTRLYGSRRREARAINSKNLSWVKSGFSDVDYLAARGMSGSPLGANLERLKYGLDRGAYRACVELLSEKFRRRAHKPAPASLVHATLHEFLDDQCTVCGGACSSHANALPATQCQACEGSGERQYTDAERAHAASVTLASWSRHERDYLVLLDCIRSTIGAHRKGLTMALSDTEDD